MKKFIVIFFISSLLIFNNNPLSVSAESKNVTQGLYTIKDLELRVGSTYNIRNTSPGKSLIIVIDANQLIQQLMRLDADSPKYTLKPLNYGDIIVIIGGSTLEFSS